VILTASALEAHRLRVGITGDIANLDRVLLSHAGRGGALGVDAHCRVVTAWDVRSRETWLSAHVELRFPVFVGFADWFPGHAALPGEHRLGLRAHLPVLSYRFGTEPVSPGAVRIEAAGPLEGLALAENREWLETLMRNHALALVRGSDDPHRLGNGNPLYYAYGVGGTLKLEPEALVPSLVLAMHPSHWGEDPPREVDDRTPPYLALRTFGSNPDALDLAVSLTISENLLGALAR
jgi:hypothetical protein